MKKGMKFFRYENVEIPVFFATGLFLILGTIFVDIVSIGFILIKSFLTNIAGKVCWDVIGCCVLVECVLIMMGLFLINNSKRKTNSQSRSQYKTKYFKMLCTIIGIALSIICLSMVVIILVIKLWITGY